MSVSIKDVEHIASLARLHIDDSEKQGYADRLSQILEHAGKIAELDTSAVEPTAHAVSLADVYREDVVTPSIPHADAIKNAPVAEKGYIRVPKIV